LRVKYLNALERQLDAMTESFFRTLPSLAIAIIIVLITWRLARLGTAIGDRLTRNTSLRKDLQQLIETMTRLLIWLVGLLIAATAVVPGLTPASLFAGLGVGAVAIGFAFQDIFQNFLAGVLIMVREKMRIGDIIECQGIGGRVERITLRETHVRQLSNELTIVPNSLLFKNPVKVLTDENLRRDEITVGIGYGTAEDIEKTIELIRKAVHDCPNVSSQKPVVAVLREFTGGAINVLVQWWTAALDHDMRLTRSEVMLAIRRAIDAEKIAVPPGGPTAVVLQSWPPLVLEGASPDKKAEEKPDS
jgi:small-conductance mechanosensitive channel